MNIKYLLDHDFDVKTYTKGEVIYQPGTKPRYVYFIKSGKVKMVTVNADGNEFIQGIFKVNEYFGEPALILDKPYLASTVAIQDAEIIPVTKEAFFKFLENEHSFSLKLIQDLSARLFYKSMMLEELANEQAEHRVNTVINYLLNDIRSGEQLNITRQQLADMSGLRVETVIRAIRKSPKQPIFKLIKGKIVKL
ncbi:MAG: Crp/Fnr family transcriptional regulator [Bacteroidota bacterium]